MNRDFNWRMKCAKLYLIHYDVTEAGSPARVHATALRKFSFPLTGVICSKETKTRCRTGLVSFCRGYEIIPVSPDIDKEDVVLVNVSSLRVCGNMDYHAYTSACVFNENG